MAHSAGLDEQDLQDFYFFLQEERHVSPLRCFSKILHVLSDYKNSKVLIIMEHLTVPRVCWLNVAFCKPTVEVSVHITQQLWNKSAEASLLLWSQFCAANVLGILYFPADKSQ